MIKNYREGIGIITPFVLEGNNFVFISLGIHYHSDDEEGAHEEECSFRWGVYATFANVRFGIGWVRKYS